MFRHFEEAASLLLGHLIELLHAQSLSQGATSYGFFEPTVERLKSCSSDAPLQDGNVAAAKEFGSRLKRVSHGRLILAKYGSTSLFDLRAES